MTIMPSPRWLTASQQRAWRRYRRMRTLLDLQIARDLGTRLFWSTSRLAHHIGRMEQRGLVARQPCPGDARGAIITLTPHGRDTLTTAAPPHVASVRRHLIDLLTPDEIAALDAIATKVITHLAGQDTIEPPGPDPACAP